MGPETVHLCPEASSVNGFGLRTIPWVTSWLREYCQVEKTARRRRICCYLKHSLVILVFPSTFALPIFMVFLIKGKWLSGSTIGRTNWGTQLKSLPYIPQIQLTLTIQEAVDIRTTNFPLQISKPKLALAAYIKWSGIEPLYIHLNTWIISRWLMMLSTNKHCANDGWDMLPKGRWCGKVCYQGNSDVGKTTCVLHWHSFSQIILLLAVELKAIEPTYAEGRPHIQRKQWDKQVFWISYQNMTFSELRDPKEVQIRPFTMQKYK